MRSISFVLLCLFPALALAEPSDYTIPSQPADAAVLTFSAKSRCEVLFSSDELHREHSAALNGTMEPEEALRRLLQGTGFTAVRTGKNKFIIKRLPPPSGGIRGRVLDASGKPLPGVQVRLLPSGSLVLTDASGAFAFGSLALGDYGLSLNSSDYHPMEIESLHLHADHDITVESRMTASTDPAPLAPLYVEGAPSNRNVFKRSQLSPITQTAVGNLDLIRSEDDALPYRVYSRSQIQRSGVINLNDFLQRELLDSDAATRPPEQDAHADGFNGFTAGSSNLSLRGYSSEETIVLINGRRLPEMLTSNRDSGPPPPDVNLIPLGLVERVEVLPLSSSALYSGNPVGGVINIVLAPARDITELSTSYTNATGGYDAPQSAVTLSHGRSLLGGKLQLQLTANYTRSVPVTEAELGYIQNNNAKSNDPELLLYRATPNVRSSDKTPLFGAGTASVTSAAPGSDGTGGLNPFLERQGLASTDLFRTPAGMANSPNSLNYAYGRRQERNTFYAASTYDIAPWLQLGLTGLNSHTVVNRGWDVLQGNLTLAAASPLNPFHQDLTVTLNETTPLLGTNYGEGRLEFNSFTAGLLARLPADWRLSSDIQYSRSLTRHRGLAGADASRWQGLVDSGQYNPLRDTQVYGPPEAFYEKALIYYGGRDRFVTIGDYQTIDASLRASNRELSLPAGGGVLNVGCDYRRNQLAGFSNVQRLGDGSLAADPIDWDGRKLERVSVFGEAQAPLLPASWKNRWVRSVEADLAARYIVSANSTESNLAPTEALKVVFGGGFSLRGAVAATNRMAIPVMSRKKASEAGDAGGEIYNAIIYDPLRNQRYSIQAHDAVNTHLHSEAALTKSVGLLYQHGKQHRFRLSLDFSDTNKTGELNNLDANQILNLESYLPERVTRAPLAPGDTHAAGYVTSVLTGSFNLARRRSQNWISSLDYQCADLLGGVLELNTRWFYYQRYELQLLPNSELVDELETPDGAAPRILRGRAFVSLGWFNKDRGFGVDAHYFDSRKLPQKEWASQASDHVASYWQSGAYVQENLGRWLLPRESRFSLKGQLRVDNLTNARPPRYANDASGAGVQAYADWRGRVYSLSLTLGF